MLLYHYGYIYIIKYKQKRGPADIRRTFISKMT